MMREEARPPRIEDGPNLSAEVLSGESPDGHARILIRAKSAANYITRMAFDLAGARQVEEGMAAAITDLLPGFVPAPDSSGLFTRCGGGSATRGCGRRILWVRTEKGKLMPVDPEPEQRVVLLLSQSIRRGPEGRKDHDDSPMTLKEVRDWLAPSGGVPRDGAVAAIRATFVPHHATCPAVDQFRKEAR